MSRVPPDTSAEEPDGGNLQVRIWRGPGLGDRPRLLNSIRWRVREQNLLIYVVLIGLLRTTTTDRRVKNNVGASEA
jgi:hypothetical protein